MPVSGFTEIVIRFPGSNDPFRHPRSLEYAATGIKERQVRSLLPRLATAGPVFKKEKIETPQKKYQIGIASVILISLRILETA